MHGGDREDAVDGILQCLAWIGVGRLRLQPQQRRDRLQVVLDAVVDLLCEDPAHHRASVLQSDRRVVRDRCEQRPFVGCERRVAVTDELADLTALPAQRQPDGVQAGTSSRPGDVAVFEHERGTGRAHRLHRRLHDRLEGLLEVQRFGDRFRDLGQSFELDDPALSLCVELGMLDRLRHLRRDRGDEVDLVVCELPRCDRADVQGSGESLSRDDRHRKDRLVLVLRQIREELEARIEVRLCRDHDRRSFGRRGTGDPFAGTHPRALSHLLHARSMRRPEDELVAPFVVEVDEAGVGVEDVRNLARDKPEHLLQIERRVDRRDRLGQEAKVPLTDVHQVTQGAVLAAPRCVAHSRPARLPANPAIASAFIPCRMPSHGVASPAPAKRI